MHTTSQTQNGSEVNPETPTRKENNRGLEIVDTLAVRWPITIPRENLEVLHFLL